MVKIVKCEVCGQQKKILNNAQERFIHCRIKQDVETHRLLASPPAEPAQKQKNDNPAPTTPKQPKSNDSGSQEPQQPQDQSTQEPSQDQGSQEPQQDQDSQDDIDIAEPQQDQPNPDDYDYICTSCKEMFNKSGNEVNEGEEGVKCPDCGEVY